MFFQQILKKFKRGKMIICQYCKSFQISKEIDPNNKTRLCYMALKEVNPQTIYCKFFNIIDIIYCLANSQRYYYVVCLERQNQDICRCCQGELIRVMYQISNTNPRIKKTKTPIYLKSEENR